MPAPTPDTVHFLAQMIRHHRGVVTALEKFANSPTFSREQVLMVVMTARGVLDSYEAQLSRVEVQR